MENQTEAIRTTVVPISGVIRTTVVPISGVIGPTVVRIAKATGIGYRHDGSIRFFLTSLRMYLTFNLSLTKLIMCLAIEIHSKLTFLLIMNKKTSLT